MASDSWTLFLGKQLTLGEGRAMLRLMGFLLVVAGIGALFGPRRLRIVFWLLGAGAILYTVLRLAGIVDGPRPAGMG
jgi:hypothetical protein